MFEKQNFLLLTPLFEKKRGGGNGGKLSEIEICLFTILWRFFSDSYNFGEFRKCGRTERETSFPCKLFKCKRETLRLMAIRKIGGESRGKRKRYQRSRRRRKR